MADNDLSVSGGRKDSVIIYSGGLDSTTLLYEERERIAVAVTFDYGSNHGAREHTTFTSARKSNATHTPRAPSNPTIMP